MRRAAWALALTVVAVASATAGEREWREKRKEFEAALEHRPRKNAEPEAVAAAEQAVQDALDGMFAASPVSSVEYVVKDHLEGSIALTERVLGKLRAISDEKAVKTLLGLYKDARGESALLLTPVVGGLSGPDSIQALSRQLRAKQPALVLAAVRALGARGAEAADEAPKLNRLLREDSLSLRWAAAEAIGALTGKRPDGYPEPQLDPLGIPDRLWSDHVEILIDATREAGEEGFVDPTATGEGPAPTVSPYGLVGQRLREAFKDLTNLPELALTRFGRSTDSFGKGYARVRRAKDLLDLVGWYDREPRERDRDVGAALASALRRSPTPDEVFLFLTGLPSGRGAGEPLEVVAQLEELTFGRAVRVHVTAFVLEPETPPAGAQGQDALARAQEGLRSFASKLAAVTGGRATIVALARPTEAAAAASSGGAAEPAAELGVDLTKPIATRDFRKVKERFEAVLEAKVATEADLQQLEEIAACPEPKVAELVLGALSWRQPARAQAVARGAAKNPERELHRALREALAEEKDPARQLLLLSAYGPAPGKDVTEGLLDLLERLGSDARRHAWRYLSERPDTELAEAGQLKRAARDLPGLAGYYASVALSRATGSPSPSSSGLTTGGAQLLPTRFVTGGVAFLVDTHRDMDAVFQAFPAPEPTEKEPQPQPPPPATRLEAAQQELRRALVAVRTAASSANVIQLSGGSFARRVTELDRKQEAAAGSYVDGLRTKNHRDVWAALEQALEDPDVEAIHLVVSGLPLRSPAGEELQGLVTELNRGRGVQIDVVVLLGPQPEGPAEAVEKDFLSGMEALYKPIAEGSGGTLMIRREVGELEPAKR